jgi:hypothetical protein
LSHRARMCVRRVASGTVIGICYGCAAVTGGDGAGKWRLLSVLAARSHRLGDELCPR